MQSKPDDMDMALCWSDACFWGFRKDKGWYNSGYIFPDGFKSRVLFRSSVALERTCLHECFVLGKSGAYFPLPTFKVTALDRPEEPVIAKSCTGCWTQVSPLAT